MTLDYGQIPGINWSSLKNIERSPKHYRHGLTTPRPDTDTFRLGRAFHTLALEPDLFHEQYAIWPAISPTTGKATRRAGGEWDAFEALHLGAGRTILREQDIPEIEAMAAAVREDPTCAAWLDGMTNVEQVLTWTDAETGLACKGRCDLVTAAGILTDLKTARDHHPRALSRQASSLGYHAQLAYYHDGALASGIPVLGAAILGVEKKPPYDCGVLTLSDDDLHAGRAHYRALLTRLAECLDSDEWPGVYESKPQPLDLQSWAGGMTEDEDLDEF